MDSKLFGSFRRTVAFAFGIGHHSHGIIAKLYGFIDLIGID
jgi:hypothetical protein